MARRPSSLLALAAASVGVTAAAIALPRILLATPPPADAVVLVTGGSRGLGWAIASRFAERPVRLVLVSRNLVELQQAQADLLATHAHLTPAKIHLVAADLATPPRAGAPSRKPLRVSVASMCLSIMPASSRLGLLKP